MSISIQDWHRFTYDQCWVSCAKEIKVPVDFESVIVPHFTKKCGGKLWYRWDEIGKKTLDITCDRCVPSFHEKQLDLFKGEEFYDRFS
jgi:hypothetical protein